MAELSSSFDLRQSFCVSNTRQKFFLTILQTDVRRDEEKFEFKSGGKKAENLAMALVLIVLI